MLLSGYHVNEEVNMFLPLRSKQKEESVTGQKQGGNGVETLGSKNPSNLNGAALLGF